MKPRGSTVPHPPPEYEYLVASDSHNYVHRYAAHRQSLAKIRELEQELSAGKAPPEAIQHLAKLKREVASANWGKGFEPPERVVFDLGPYKDRATGRILVARRMGPDSLRYCAYRSKDDLIDEVVSSLIWHDPQSRNVPYSPLCIYPMTEEGVPCGLYIDAEEEFESPREAHDVPTDEQLVTPDEYELCETDEGYGSSDATELAIRRNEKKRAVVQRARQHFERAWRDRENAFALRCRWILILVKQSVASMFGVDLSESPVWWYTACSRFKNSFRIYVPDWVFVNVEQLHAVMSNALAMLNLMPDNHPCRLALRLAMGTVQKERNPYIIDWSVYNKHRQMRAPFQPKDPTKRNAFVPYDGTALGRLRMLTRRDAAIRFEPALCVAFDKAQRTLFTCLPHALPFELGDARSTKQLDMILKGCRKALENRAWGLERMRASFVVAALMMEHRRTRDVSARSAKEAGRIEALRGFVTDHNDWLMNLAVPKGTARRRHTKEIPLIVEAFMFIFAVQATRYVYSWRDEHTEQMCGINNHIDFPNDNRLTAAMRAVFVRTLSYHTLFAMVALERNHNEVLHADLSPSAAPVVKEDGLLTLHRRNLILIHALPSIPAVMTRISSGSKGSLTPFEPGLMTPSELDIIWTPTAAEEAANSPFTKRREFETVWEIVERKEAAARQQNSVADKPPVGSNNPGNPPSASCPDSARAEFPPQKKRALQDKLSQNPARGVISPAHDAPVGLVAPGRPRGASSRPSTLYAFQPTSDPGAGGTGSVPGISTQDAAY